MKTIYYPETQRGGNKIEWLDSKFSFSFANYHNPAKIHFGALRVLNDDSVSPSMGFGMHPHDNMEIVTIILEGELQHNDSMGHTALIKAGEVQHMTAGTGITHSEINSSKTQTCKLLQLWVFPRAHNLIPSYDQRFFDAFGRQNQWQYLVTPNGGDAIKAEQETYFVRNEMQSSSSTSYDLHGEYQGAYVFVIEGTVEVNGHLLSRRDAIGIWEVDRLNFTAEFGADVLIVEVPMRW
ncbi:MAG: hypothetical protein CK532_07510 [Flavobacteriales bacterium]|nr:MAG: hypothetical protein CK532_07510 [Flavobacteriales bacterium]